MKIPFTTTEFLEVFSRYNRAIGPAQFALLGLAVFAVVAMMHRERNRQDLVFGILATLWFWSGVVYQGMFFSRLSPAGFVFGAIFAGQAVYFLALARRAGRAGKMATSARGKRITGLAILMYALFVYPLLAFAAGHRWPAVPTFGTPCPTVLLTIGLLLLIEPPLPRFVWIVPLLWAGIGISAAVSFGVYEDWGLPLAAAAAFGWLLRSRGETSANQGDAAESGAANHEITDSNSHGDAFGSVVR